MKVHLLLACLSVAVLSACQTEPADVPGAVRVGTYNIRHCRSRGQLIDKLDGENFWDRRKADTAAFLRKLDLDVFGLQEVYPEQLAYLRAALPEYTFVGEHRHADRVSGEASPVCYRTGRFEAVRSGTFWLSETPDVPGSQSWETAAPRICSYLILKDRRTGGTFCFANTHTDHRSALAREKGMLLIIERMKVFGEGAPIVFVGDHNCFETSAPSLAVAKILDNAMMTSETSPRGSWRTFNGWDWRDRDITIAEALRETSEFRNSTDYRARVGGVRIDYIYVTPGMRVLDYETVNAPRPGLRRYPSDHFPVVSTLVPVR